MEKPNAVRESLMRFVNAPRCAFAGGSAEPALRRPLGVGLASVLLLCGVVAGCSSAPELRADAPAIAVPTEPAAAAPVALTSTPAAMVQGPEPEPAVPPAAKRAFDEARRAMRAGRMQDAERGFKSVVQSHPE